MRIKKPGKSDVKDAFVIAVLLIVISYVKSMVRPWLSSFTGTLGDVGRFVDAAIVGIVVATVFSLVGYPKYGTLAFALAVGSEIYAYVEENYDVGV